MAAHTSLDGPKSAFYYRFWIIVFSLGVFALLATLYIATKKVEYTWRWNRVPQYFLYEEKVDIRAEMEGEIGTIETHGQDVRVLIRGETAKKPTSCPRLRSFWARETTSTPATSSDPSRI